jgi:hypothetical protein
MAKPKTESEKESNLEFEEVLEDLLKIKPVENEDLKKDARKKKSKSKTEK